MGGGLCTLCSAAVGRVNWPVALSVGRPSDESREEIQPPDETYSTMYATVGKDTEIWYLQIHTCYCRSLKMDRPLGKKGLFPLENNIE